MDTIYIVIGPLLDGLPVEQIADLLSKASKSDKSLFPFYVAENNSAAFGFIPQYIVDETEFDEDAFSKFVLDQMDKNCGGEDFTVSFSSTIDVTFMW